MESWGETSTDTVLTSCFIVTILQCLLLSKLLGTVLSLYPCVSKPANHRATRQNWPSPWPGTNRNLPFGLESSPAPTTAISGFIFFLNIESQTLNVLRAANVCIFNSHITLRRCPTPFFTHCWAGFQTAHSSVSPLRDYTLVHALTPLTSRGPLLSMFPKEGVAAGGHLWKLKAPSSFGTMNHLPSLSQL